MVDLSLAKAHDLMKSLPLALDAFQVASLPNIGVGILARRDVQGSRNLSANHIEQGVISSTVASRTTRRPMLALSLSMKRHLRG